MCSTQPAWHPVHCILFLKRLTEVESKGNNESRISNGYTVSDYQSDTKSITLVNVLKVFQSQSPSRGRCCCRGDASSVQKEVQVFSLRICTEALTFIFQKRLFLIYAQQLESKDLKWVQWEDEEIEQGKKGADLSGNCVIIWKSWLLIPKQQTDCNTPLLHRVAIPTTESQICFSGGRTSHHNLKIQSLLRGRAHNLSLSLSYFQNAAGGRKVWKPGQCGALVHVRTLVAPLSRHQFPFR